MSATCWLWFASCQWGIPISLSPPLPFIFLFTIHLTTYRGGRILVISCWIGNLTRSLTSNGDSDPRAFQLTASRGGWRRITCTGFRIISISTHSLTRRLTASHPICTPDVPTFQLTASRGGWHTTAAMCKISVIFQLTASRGGWRIMRVWIFGNQLFQLTASRGGWQRCCTTYPCRKAHFNSQPHEEADF